MGVGHTVSGVAASQILDRRDQHLEMIEPLRNLGQCMQELAVATGSFDRPGEFPPNNVHCGTESQVPWLKIDDNLPRKTTREAMGYEVEN